MQTKYVGRSRVVTAVAFALLCQPFASAKARQNPVPSQTGSQFDSSKPSQENLAANNASPPVEAEPVAPVSPQPPSDQLPDSPGVAQSRSARSNAQLASATLRQHQSLQEQRQSQLPDREVPAREPVGTAAAESVRTTGVAASRPAGAALAPAKQRRMRSILIKVGAIVGVGVAVGTTMALSQASPSKPSGTR